jgi:hypothetical protein
MSDDLKFVITDYIQNRAMWNAMAKRVGLGNEGLDQTIELYTAAIMVPITGKALQKLGTHGFEPDGFMQQRGSFRFETRADIRQIDVIGWLPEQHPGEVEIGVTCFEYELSQRCRPGASFRIGLPVEIAPMTEGAVCIELSTAFQPSVCSSESSDSRILGCILIAVEFS